MYLYPMSKYREACRSSHCSRMCEELGKPPEGIEGTGHSEGAQFRTKERGKAPTVPLFPVVKPSQHGGCSFPRLQRDESCLLHHPCPPTHLSFEHVL
jgi:hypothetical protein